MPENSISDKIPSSSNTCVKRPTEFPAIFPSELYVWEGSFGSDHLSSIVYTRQLSSVSPHCVLAPAHIT